MTFLQSLILGIIQGITEFLPVSSSAHLVLIPYLLNWTFPTAQIFPFDVLVQLGTLVAVILYFWKDLINIVKSFFKGLIDKEPFKDPQARLGWYLILATIPAGVLGLLIKKQVEAAFSSPRLTALFLFVTAALLILADCIGKRTRQVEDLNWWDALWMGLFQALSIFPGISRSGSTISAGMTRNLDRTSSARFSFLMSIPVMLGAGIVSLKDLSGVPDLASFIPILLIGFAAAVIVGYLSIHWLLDFIKRKKLWYFTIYCIVLACVVLLVNSVRTGNVKANTVLENPTATVPALLAENSDLKVIKVQYSSSLSWLTSAMTSCANLVENIGLVTHITPAKNQSLQNADLLLRWGAPTTLSNPSYQIGNEHLAVSVKRDNPLQTLSLDTARQVFSGEITTWGALHSACPDCFSQTYNSSLENQPIDLNLYPPEEDIHDIIVNVVMNGRPVAISNSLLVPNPAASLETIASSSNSIGFLPAHDLDARVKEISITGLNSTVLQQPILAITQTKPQGKTLEWLICLQKVINP